MINITTQTIDDQANHPSHYTKGSIECIDAIESALGPDNFIGYLQGNILKYIWRFPFKGGLLDLKKAKFYLEKLIEVLEKEDDF